jgi:hypothetical protein
MGRGEKGHVKMSLVVFWVLCYHDNMGPLIKTNPYLRKTPNVRRLIEADARESCAFEGARLPLPKVHSLRRSKASAKKSAKGA